VTRDALLQDILALVEPFAEGKDVSEATRLHADLGMTGDDAADFVTAFGNKYEIEMSEFVWLRYFEDEGLDLLSPALIWIGQSLSPAFARRWRAARDAEREITIADLADMAEARRWHHPSTPKLAIGEERWFARVISATALLVQLFLFGLGALTLYAYLSGQIGSVNLVTLFGIAAVSALFPLLGLASWRNIQRKLASA
jgi:hypothetical protein